MCTNSTSLLSILFPFSLSLLPVSISLLGSLRECSCERWFSREGCEWGSTLHLKSLWVRKETWPWPFWGIDHHSLVLKQYRNSHVCSKPHPSFGLGGVFKHAHTHTHTHTHTQSHLTVGLLKAYLWVWMWEYGDLATWSGSKALCKYKSVTRVYGETLGGSYCVDISGPAVCVCDVCVSLCVSVCLRQLALDERNQPRGCLTSVSCVCACLCVCVGVCVWTRAHVWSREASYGTRQMVLLTSRLVPLREHQMSWLWSGMKEPDTLFSKMTVFIFPYLFL